MNFLDIKPSRRDPVQLAGHRDDIVDRSAVRTYNPVPVSTEALSQAADLRAAAGAFELRGQTRNAETCRDLASKLDRFGSFVSDKQAGYAKQLVEWARPHQTAQAPVQAAPQAPARASVVLPQLHELMQRLSKLQIGELTIARKNQDQLCWVKHRDAEKVVGRIDNGVLTLWQRPMIDLQDVTRQLLEIEADPRAAAVLHGKASGRCSICSRDLTDERSIAIGVGPICFGKAGW
jgi:hypothetical protein